MNSGSIRARRRILVRLAMMFSGILVGIVVVEVALRVAGFSYPSFWTLDMQRGWAARPGTEGRYIKEGDAYVRMNREGFRDDDHEIPKPPGGLRIAVVGDSFVEALQVPLEATFWRKVGSELARCGEFANRSVEVLGFGGSGYGTAQERITYLEFVTKYQPDIVLLAFYVGNDVSDNYRGLDYMANRPYYVFRNGELILDTSFRDRFALHSSGLKREHLVSLVDRIRILQLVKEVRHRVKETSIRGRSRPTEIEPGIENLVFVPPEDTMWKEAWRVTEGILTALRNDVANSGSDFWLMVIPTPEQVYPDQSHRAEFMTRLGVESLSYPENRLRSWADRESVPFVNLSDDFRRVGERDSLFLYGFDDRMGSGHWNESGHRVAGELVAARICDFYAGKSH